MWLVYIIYSRINKQTYIGSTDNFSRRIKQHNSNIVKSTKNKGCWIPIYIEFYPNEKLAREREKILKTSVGRRYLKKAVNGIINSWGGSSIG